MKNKKRKWMGWLLAIACLVSMLFAMPVSAEMTGSAEEALAQTVHDYLSNIFMLDDGIYDQLKASGGFYEIMVDTIRENRDTVGDVEEIGEVKVEEGSSAITCTAKVKFENYNAEVVLTFDGQGAMPKNFVMNIDYPLGEKMKQAGMNTVTGILVVFVILVFLAGVISLFGVFSRGEKNEAAQKMEESAVEKPVAAKPSVPTDTQTAEDLELAIVLAAAIAAAEEEQPSNDGYVVRSIKKVNTTRRWKRV